jgi:7-carboxy-7-deazaguanine synthase
MALTVNEIFYSIQGESTYAGKPCAFIRLTGCNLRCAYCDTAYAYAEGREMAVEEIMARVLAFQCPLVEVTGGEPLLQTETPSLIQRFLDCGFTVLLETNGTRDISRVDSRCIRIVDVKCPSSREADRADLKNLERLSDHDQVKFVIGTREDYEYARKILGRICGQCPVHFSPVFKVLEPAVLARWILEDRLKVSLHLQLHKFIWPPDQRGV